MSRFISTELKSDSESSDSDLDSEKIGAKVDNELMTKLEKSGSVSEQNILLLIIFNYTFLVTLNKSFYF